MAESLEYRWPDMDALKPLHTADVEDGNIPGHGQGHGRDPDLEGGAEDLDQGRAHVLEGAILDQGLAAVHVPTHAHVQGPVLEVRVGLVLLMIVNQNPQRRRIRRMEWMRTHQWKKISRWTILVPTPNPDPDLVRSRSRGLGQSHGASQDPGHVQGLGSELHQPVAVFQRFSYGIKISAYQDSCLFLSRFLQYWHAGQGVAVVAVVLLWSMAGCCSAVLWREQWQSQSGMQPTGGAARRSTGSQGTRPLLFSLSQPYTCYLKPRSQPLLTPQPYLPQSHIQLHILKPATIYSLVPTAKITFTSTCSSLRSAIT